MPGELPPVEIGDNEIFWRKRALVHAGGSRKNAVTFEPHREVSFTGDDISAFVHPTARDANFPAMLFFALRVAGQK
jgi:hypothetical protein